jgi:acetyltransferase-like isoleucine patch superfamily enzyme
MLGRAIYQALRLIRALKLRTLDRLTTYYYRIVCRRFGPGSSIGWGTWISQPYNVIIGRGVRIGRGVLIGSESESSQLYLSDNVNINDGAKIDFSGGLVVCENSFVSEGVIMYSHSHGLNPRSEPILYPKRIEKDVWIGARAVIMHGCASIGSKVIVGAACIVTRDVKSGGIVVGQKARCISGKKGE